MSTLSSQIIPSIETLSILGETVMFKKWINKHHSLIESDRLFQGYRFSLMCCINAFIEGICTEKLLDIQGDFLFDSAVGQLIPLHKIRSNSERATLLRNIKPHVKSISRAKGFNEIEQEAHKFLELVKPEIEAIKRACKLSIKVSREVAEELLMIDFTHTFLNQIKNNGPAANFLNPISNDQLKPELKDQYLYGYKFAIQFLWFQILGETKFQNTQLTKLHLSQSWSDYIYHKKPTSEIEIFNRSFDLEKQTCFDSFFYWIQKEITDPLQKEFGFPIYQIDHHFHFQPENYNKTVFSVLSKTENSEKSQSQLSIDERISETLYWYPMEIIRSREALIHHGIPSFNTMLAGTVALHDPDKSPFEQVIIAKFTHPHQKDKTKNDYSFGILVDSKSAAGHYSSGWVIYRDVCGDYSGFSRSELRECEHLISSYKKLNKIELRELNLSLEIFTEFTNRYTSDHKLESIIEQNKLIPDIMRKSKSRILELYTYYICSKAPCYSGYVIELNQDKKGLHGGEKDIVLKRDDEVIIIECKINLQNSNIPKLIEKLSAKVSSSNVNKKSGQIWTWEKLSSKSKRKLELASKVEFPISYVELDNPREHVILNGFNINELRHIFQKL